MVAGRRTSFLMIPITALMLGSCADSGPDAATNADAAAGALPLGHVPVSADASPTQGQAPTVTVLETMDGGGYTYARVSADGGEAWVAAPQTELEVGDVVVVSDLMQMTNFSSSTLNRTFDVLYFASSFAKTDGEPGGGATMSLGTSGGGQHASGSAPTGGADMSDAPRGTVTEILGGGGYMYLHVAMEEDSVWLAGPGVEVSEGQTVSWLGAMTMNDFNSASLERTFAEIIFVERVVVVR
jgi:hypothetical protein